MSRRYGVPNRFTERERRSASALMANFDEIVEALNAFDGGNIRDASVGPEKITSSILSKSPASQIISGYPPSTLRYVTIDPRLAGSDFILNFSGEIHIVPIIISQATRLTGLRWFQRTSGNYTASDNNRIGLYKLEGSSLRLVASCTNDVTLWRSNGSRFKAFRAAYEASAGIYWIAALHCRSAVVQWSSIGSNRSACRNTSGKSPAR
jgi:hypothetical protein